jgi:ribonuclease HI
VENRDLIEEILARIEEREVLGIGTRFEWLKGHDGAWGNEEADRLAVEGARRKVLGLEVVGVGEEDEDADVDDDDEE